MEHCTVVVPLQIALAEMYSMVTNDGSVTVSMTSFAAFVPARTAISGNRSFAPPTAVAVV